MKRTKLRPDLLEPCSYGSWNKSNLISYWKTCPDGFVVGGYDVQITEKRGSFSSRDFAKWFQEIGIEFPTPIFRKKPERWTFRFLDASDAVAFKLRFSDVLP